MQIVKITIESENGRYKFYTDSLSLLSVMDNPVFTQTQINPMNGKTIIHGEEVKKALKLNEKGPQQ